MVRGEFPGKGAEEIPDFIARGRLWDCGQEEEKEAPALFEGIAQDGLARQPPKEFPKRLRELNFFTIDIGKPHQDGGHSLLPVDFHRCFHRFKKIQLAERGRTRLEAGSLSHRELHPVTNRLHHIKSIFKKEIQFKSGEVIRRKNEKGSFS